MKNLDPFFENLAKLYPDSYKSIIKTMQQGKPTTFRINRTKTRPEKILNALLKEGFQIIEGPLNNSYILINESNKRLSETKFFINGEIYLQEFSSMLPVIILAPSQDEKILDIAAAPGSKTTQLAEITHNKAFITAIEKHPLRLRTLNHNINLQNSRTVNIIKGNGIKFDKRNPQYINYFEKAIVDVPCSSEGRFYLNNPKTYRYWNIKKRKEIASIQKGLLISAFRMLNPGGILVYSTCTFGMEENELVIDWLFKKVGNEAEIQKISLPVSNFIHGFTSYNEKQLYPEIQKTIRIIPNELFTGFYLAKIKKLATPS